MKINLLSYQPDFLFFIFGGGGGGADKQGTCQLSLFNREQTMQHLLRCLLLENECSLEDLATANEKALHCARAWPNIWLSSGMMDTKEE